MHTQFFWKIQRQQFLFYLLLTRSYKLLGINCCTQLKLWSVVKRLLSEVFEYFKIVGVLQRKSVRKRCLKIRIMTLFNPLPKDGDDTFAFPKQCVMLKFNGAWPLTHKSGSRNMVDHLYLCWAYALIILIALTCCAQALYLFASWGDILVVTECGCTVFMGIHNLLRLMHLSYNRRALKKLIADFVKQIWISR